MQPSIIRPSQTKLNLNHISFFTTVNMALVQEENKENNKNQDGERQEFILQPLRSMINFFRKSKLSRHLLSNSTKTRHFMAPRTTNLKMDSDLQIVLKPQNHHFMMKDLKKNSNLEKMLKMRKTYAPQILQRTTKKLMKTNDTKNLMRIMARHLECHIG